MLRSLHGCCENLGVKPRALLRLWPAAALALAAWPAIHWLFWPGYLSTYDGIYHLTRMIEVDSLVRQGILYPRWFPDFGQGHGYPIFTFFPPFAYLLTEVPALILGSLPLAIQVSMAASMVISGWGMYLLAREIGAARLAAFFVAGFYLYFPYHVQDVYTRGGLPELWAIALLPWLAWAQLRGTREPTILRVGVAGLLAAGIIGTHNILAAFMLPASLALSLSLAPPKRRFVLSSLACTAAGIVLATGYWLPAIVEAPLTHVKQLAGDWLPDHTFALNQLLDGGFFAPYGPKVFKMTALEAGIVAALLALLLWRVIRSRRRLPELGLIGLTLGAVFGLTTWSVPLWTHVPLVGYIQFPWRLLILVGFFAAAMLALVVSWHRWAWIAAGAIATAIAVASLAQVPDQRFLTPPPLDASTLQTQEYGSALDGVAIESEYQPQTSAPDLMKAAQGKRLPEDTTSAPPVQVQDVALRGTNLHATVTADQASALRLQPLMFPGWRARLDGRPWSLEPATPAGVVEARIPPGRHRLDLDYAGTTLEGLAGLISGAALLTWLLSLVVPLPSRWERRGEGTPRWPRAAATLALTAAAITMVGHLQQPPTPAAAADWPASPDQTLVSYQAPKLTASGIEADLFWQYTAPREAAFDFVLRDASGQEALRTPASAAAALPYEYVAANELLERRYTIGRPSASGTYTLFAGAQPLGQVTVPPLAEPAPHPLDVAFQDRATLAAYAVDRVKGRPGLAIADLQTRADAAAYPGDFLRVALTWHASRTIDQNYVAFVHLIDASGKAWALHDNQPNATMQATGSWVPGSTVHDGYLLKLPDDIPPGMYRLEVGLYHIDELGYHFLKLASGGNTVVFGAVKILPSSAPPAANPIASWSEPIALDGWRQGPQGTFTFSWRAAGEPSRAYTLFVHLSDPSGKVVAQADSPPQQGLYPTRLWDPGDRVSDTHVVHAPPGRYRLSIGWYRPDTGQRLPLATGGDELDLGEVQVG